MDKLKQWVVLTLVAVLVVGAGGWFLLISPKHSEAADLRLQADKQQSANSALQTQLALLKAQAKDLPKQQARLAAVAAKIPDNPALPALIRALDKAAAAAGVELVSISPAAPTAVVAGGTALPVTAGAAPVAGATGGVGQLKSIAVTLSVVGGYFQVEQFLDGLESLSRAMKVTGFTLAPGSSPVKPSASSVDTGKSLTASISSTVYLASGRPTTVPVTAGVKS